MTTACSCRSRRRLSVWSLPVLGAPPPHTSLLIHHQKQEAGRRPERRQRRQAKNLRHGDESLSVCCSAFTIKLNVPSAPQLKRSGTCGAGLQGGGGRGPVGVCGVSRLEPGGGGVVGLFSPEQQLEILVAKETLNQVQVQS